MAQDDPIPISAKVPCSVRGLLTFSWGLGTELRFCDIQHPITGEGGNNPFKSTVVWCEDQTPGAALQPCAHAALMHSCMHACRLQKMHVLADGCTVDCRSAPSPSHKVLAHAVASAQEELVLMQGRGRQATSSAHEVTSPELLSFCKKVRQALAKERWGMDEDRWVWHHPSIHYFGFVCRFTLLAEQLMIHVVCLFCQGR